MQFYGASVKVRSAAFLLMFLATGIYMEYDLPSNEKPLTKAQHHSGEKLALVRGRS